MPKPKLDLRPKSLDLELYAGDGATIQLSVIDNQSRPIPVDGVVTAQIRVNRLDADSLVSFDANLTQAQEGIVLVSLTGEKTASLITDEPLFRGVWDVQWLAPDTEPITLIQGRVNCYADVTR